MFCSNCGKELADNVAFCPECGAAQKVSAPREEAPQAAPQQPAYNAQPQYQQPQYQQQNTNVDSGNIGWGILGCCIPIAGLILFLVWKGEKPKTAKAAGIGALVSVGLCVVFYILSFIVGFATTMSM